MISTLIVGWFRNPKYIKIIIRQRLSVALKGAGRIHQDFLEIDFLVVSNRGK